MDHFNQTHASDYYTGTQPNLLHNGRPERSSIHIMSTNGTSYTPLSKPTSRPKNESWKTTSNTTTESWKMSGKPRHAQLHYLQDDPKNRRQSAPLFNSPKPLPQEPTPIIQQEPFNLVYPPGIHDQYTTQAPFHLNTPVQQHIPHYSHNEIYSSAPFNQAYPPVHDYVPPPLVDYQHYHHHQPYQDYPPVISSHANFSPLPTPESLPPAPPLPPPQTVQETPKPTNIPTTKADEKSKEKNKDTKLEKKIRQITVQSINIEHRVWIDVLPAETGLSLAEKIHIIATFRTRKIVSITTASGRKIPLDNRPVFGSWMDMEKFEDGERWTVEWRENDRGVVDRFMAKIVQSKRKD